MQQIGRYAHPHDAGVYALKRYAISRMLGLGLDPRTIASITGHRTVSLILDRYARTHEDRQRAALAALAAAGVPRCAQIEMATQSKGPASA
jgi:integrase